MLLGKDDPMKALHFPFHIHRFDRREMATKLHHLVHDDRFWAIAVLVLLLTLFVVISILTVKSGAKINTDAPYFY